MATTKKTTGQDKVEVVEHEVTETTPIGTIEDGIYTEKGVKLGNGAVIDVNVIVDVDMLPASVSMLMAEGNVEGMMIAHVDADTRRFLDLAGATRKDLREVIIPVIQRGKDMAE